MKQTITIKAEDIPNLIIQAGEDEYRMTKVEKEPVEFWDGQLVEGHGPRGWYGPWRFDRVTDSGNYKVFDSGGATIAFAPGSIRPLQDPLVLQFKAHKPGDPMPCDGNLDIQVKTGTGLILQGYKARHFQWSQVSPPGECIIGWMPADGWGRSE